jgi:hypothetical protein
VTQHHFIFSNARRYRLLRHITFWAVWTFAYLLLFHHPTHTFRGWSLDPASATGAYKSIQQIGVSLYFLKTLIFNSFLAVVVPHALFTYTVLYWLLPRYYYQKKNPFVTGLISAALILLLFPVFTLFKFSTLIGNYVFGIFKGINNFLAEFNSTIFWELLDTVTRDMLVSLPISFGFALLIKLVKRWWLKQKETEQLAGEKTKAELQLLKAQIHPHFLFNTLNNIYFFTLSGSPKAPEMIKKLSGLLQYIINECNQSLVPLQKEINMLKDYTALEKIRYGEQSEMTINITDDNSGSMIAPLLLIPFVENSFKHGASRMISNSRVDLRITIENGTLLFFIMNSRPKETEPQLKKGNIGLKNVKKRLELLYPDAHELNIVSEPESFAVYLKLRLQPSAVPATTGQEFKKTIDYALA